MFVTALGRHVQKYVGWELPYCYLARLVKLLRAASGHVNGPYAPFGFESIEKQLWRNKQNDLPISDSEIKAFLSQLFKTDQWLPPAGHVSEDVTSHA
ncbi:hypothetical protein AVEN_240802-1 [Araneus ventricosus]|uniref:Uncharacterized protein n=1 Tax=Araneus ventricosus TaxID=182803 RepID=A0A4Y2S3B9_ARAVE|nr:hypothetical protein AVEN_240802-1 [Araneus ventricosus]